MKTERTCPDCGITKPLTREYFWPKVRPNNKTGYGHQYRCRICDNRNRNERKKQERRAAKAAGAGESC